MTVIWEKMRAVAIKETIFKTIRPTPLLHKKSYSTLLILKWNRYIIYLSVQIIFKKSIYCLTSDLKEKVIYDEAYILDMNVWVWLTRSPNEIVRCLYPSFRMWQQQITDWYWCVVLVSQKPGVVLTLWHDFWSGEQLLVKFSRKYNFPFICRELHT